MQAGGLAPRQASIQSSRQHVPNKVPCRIFMSQGLKVSVHLERGCTSQCVALRHGPSDPSLNAVLPQPAASCSPCSSMLQFAVGFVIYTKALSFTPSYRGGRSKPKMGCRPSQKQNNGKKQVPSP